MELKLNGIYGGIMKYSPEDHELIQSLSIFLTKEGYCSITGSTSVHRLIMNAQPNQKVDHINGNRSDNRRENLKFVTSQQNAQNKVKKSGTSTIYKGVTLVKSSGRYNVQIRYDKSKINIGSFSNVHDAANAYDMYVVHKKLSHNINFPLKREEYLKSELIYPKTKTNQNEYIGVNKTRNNKYSAYITINGDKKLLITTEDAIEAAETYDKYIYDNRLPGKKFNFPEKYPNFKPDKIIKTFFKVVDNTTISISINSNQSAVVLIDKDDYDLVKYYSCNIEGHGYVNISIGYETFKLSRYLTKQTDPDIYIDHINNNRLDNRRSNLRLSDKDKNGKNKTKQANCLSIYNNVNYDKNRKKWRVYVCGKHIGSFSDEILAARKRDLYILLEKPKDWDHYKLNFKWTDADIAEWKSK